MQFSFRSYSHTEYSIGMCQRRVKLGIQFFDICKTTSRGSSTICIKNSNGKYVDKQK